jgi:D-alanine-D-alanine ligase
MTQKAKIKVAVLYGGRSGEHEISLRSAKSILTHLDKDKFEAVPIGIDQTGRWYFNTLSVISGADTVLVSNKESTPAIPHADPTQATHFDVIFPALHGKWGEDGTLQGLLELTNMPYVGCGVLASAIGMDKDVSKRLVKQCGIPIADYHVAYAYEKPQQVLQRVKAQLTLPVFVKPANAGSSDGVTKVNDWANFENAFKEAAAIDRKILIEQGLTIRDVEMAVLEAKDHQAPLVSAVAGEVVNEKVDFYSKAAKYSADYFPRLALPAEITDEQLATLQRYSQQIFIALECSGLARVDFFIDKNNGDIYFNEINTLPGFTSMSLYPQMWEKSGLSFQDLLTHLIELVLEKTA